MGHPLSCLSDGGLPGKTKPPPKQSSDAGLAWATRPML